MAYLDDPMPILNQDFASARDYRDWYSPKGQPCRYKPREVDWTWADKYEMDRLLDDAWTYANAARKAKHIGQVLLERARRSLAKAREIARFLHSCRQGNKVPQGTFLDIDRMVA